MWTLKHEQQLNTKTTCMLKYIQTISYYQQLFVGKNVENCHKKFQQICNILIVDHLTSAGSPGNYKHRLWNKFVSTKST